HRPGAGDGTGRVEGGRRVLRRRVDTGPSPARAREDLAPDRAAVAPPVGGLRVRLPRDGRWRLRSGGGTDRVGRSPEPQERLRGVPADVRGAPRVDPSLPGAVRTGPGRWERSRGH